MSGTRKGGNHAMEDVTTHASSGMTAPPLQVEEILKEMSYSDIRDKAIELGVFDVGVTKKGLAQRIVRAGVGD